MYIYLPEIRSRQGEVIDYSFKEELSKSFEDFSEGDTLTLKVEVSYSGGKVLISGSFEASIAMVCSRCLEPFKQKFRTNFREAFTVVQGPPAGDARHEIALETANMLTISGEYFYLDEYIRQLVILAQDYSPLCKPDCKGICAGCGTDLNYEACRCTESDDPVDLRLLKLKELRYGS